ncbi:MAG: cysteine desulfurase family protein [Lachnospiraceae bacterium]|nr:cysteine desulfurase family protein [Lachnospiraceae bacterium]
MEAYLDNAATTPVLPEVCDIMLKVMKEDYGNPSSKHTKGMEAERYITGAAEDIAALMKCQPKEIVFTSGGTEANNMALLGAAAANARKGKHIITTGIEHASVHETLSHLEEQGFEVTYLPVNSNGILDPDVLADAIREDTILVSVMYVNNETGSVQDIGRLCSVVKKKDSSILFHTDAVQAYGKYKIVPRKLGADLLSASGHKIHAPKGSGFLYIKDKTKINPFIYGGGQQKGMRPGTENVPAIAGLGLASKIIYGMADRIENLYNLKEKLIGRLKKIDGVTINGADNILLQKTAPHIVSANFEGIRSEVLLHALAAKGVFVSSGSACSSNHPGISSTLKAIGVEDALLDSSLRFSFSVFTTEEQVDYAADVLEEELPVLRKFTRR